MSLRYYVWWFWHRFNPRRLWVKATTYEVPIHIDYGGRVTQQTFMRRKRWDLSPTTFESTTDIRCVGDEEWRTIEGTVTHDHDKSGRLVGITARFEVPCDQPDVPEVFYIDDTNLKEMP